MEGVMMRGKCSMATAVRNSDGDIVVESKRLIPVEKKNVCYRIPVLRGHHQLCDDALYRDTNAFKIKRSLRR